MDRDFGKEIDEMREEIRILKDSMHTDAAKTKGDVNSLKKFYKLSEKEFQKHREEMAKEGKNVPEWGKELAQDAIDKNYERGVIKSSGIFQSQADEGHMWNLEYSAGDLLSLEETTVEKILSAMGNRIRLKILKTILDSPADVGEIVAKFEMKTTGKAYHHLNLLESADLIYKNESGRYHFRGHRVSGFFSALVSVKNTVDEKFTAGDIDQLPLGVEL